jgi:hypothetical protein
MFSYRGQVRGGIDHLTAGHAAGCAVSRPGLADQANAPTLSIVCPAGVKTPGTWGAVVHHDRRWSYVAGTDGIELATVRGPNQELSNLHLAPHCRREESWQPEATRTRGGAGFSRRRLLLSFGWAPPLPRPNGQS